MAKTKMQVIVQRKEEIRAMQRKAKATEKQKQKHKYKYK